MAALRWTIIRTIMSAPDHFIDMFTSNGKILCRRECVYYNVTLNSQLTIVSSHFVQFTMHRHRAVQLKAMPHDNDYATIS